MLGKKILELFWPRISDEKMALKNARLGLAGGLYLVLISLFWIIYLSAVDIHGRAVGFVIINYIILFIASIISFNMWRGKAYTASIVMLIYLSFNFVSMMSNIISFVEPIILAVVPLIFFLFIILCVTRSVRGHQKLREFRDSSKAPAHETDS